MAHFALLLFQKKQGFDPRLWNHCHIGNLPPWSAHLAELCGETVWYGMHDQLSVASPRQDFSKQPMLCHTAVSPSCVGFCPKDMEIYEIINWTYKFQGVSRYIIIRYHHIWNVAKQREGWRDHQILGRSPRQSLKETFTLLARQRLFDALHEFLKLPCFIKNMAFLKSSCCIHAKFSGLFFLGRMIMVMSSCNLLGFLSACPASRTKLTTQSVGSLDTSSWTILCLALQALIDGIRIALENNCIYIYIRVCVH